MPAEIPKLQKEFRINHHPALRLGIDFHHPAANSIRIELRVPGSIKRVSEIDSPPVATHFNHLRAAVQWSARILRMSRTPHDATQMNRPSLLGMKRVGYIV